MISKNNYSSKEGALALMHSGSWSRSGAHHEDLQKVGKTLIDDAAHAQDGSMDGESVPGL